MGISDEDDDDDDDDRATIRIADVLNALKSFKVSDSEDYGEEEDDYGALTTTERLIYALKSLSDDPAAIDKLLDAKIERARAAKEKKEQKDKQREARKKKLEPVEAELGNTKFVS